MLSQFLKGPVGGHLDDRTHTFKLIQVREMLTYLLANML